MPFRYLLAGGLAVAGLCGFGAATAVQDDHDQLAPPDVRLMHPLNVNMQSRQVVASQKTVSIGGERGLSHSISLHTSHFTTTGGWYGYIDKYAGNAKYTVLGEYSTVALSGQNCNPGDQVEVMRVFGPAGSEDFKILVNGQFDCDFDDSASNPVTSGYIFQALGDARHTLEVIRSGDPRYGDYPHGLKWTTADGTELYYSRQKYATAQGRLREIVYPDGLTVSIGLGGVTTNTGFQLKYEYDTANVQGLSTAKQALYEDLAGELDNYAAGQVLQMPVAAPGQFAAANPRHVRAINRALEYCPADYDQPSCGHLKHDWPSATFTWPGGMPRAIYLDDSVFTVKDAAGGITEYHFRAHDVMLRENGKYAGNIDDVNYPYEQGTFFPYYPKQMWSPRLVGVKTADSDAFNRQYQYKNKYVLDGDGATNYWRLVDPARPAGEVAGASGPEGSGSFGTRPRQGADEIFGAWRGTLEYKIQPADTRPGTMILAVIPGEGEYRFESSYRNFVTEFQPLDGPGPRKHYEYDARGNLVRVIMEAGESDQTIRKAQYPASCSNRKTCNKPLWVEDARGNRTDYTYHPESGRIATVTGPPDRNGVRPQTRYQYGQFYAYYYRDPEPGGSTVSVKRAETPVWLMTRESYCRTSAGTDNGCAGGDTDEVVTEYHYGPQDGTPDNLMLRGVSVTAEGDGGVLETRTTCYQYDKYGNRIGETLPKGTSSGTCP